ncbi:NF-kappa-B inhibitor cactus-like [Ctenocephalides felis]|uniref:NF-kappa-B inhibitor cactus-like n=1 Tax=Ctenocephalides felis TaxID=7515 RepID=UPI000E6E167E|nr:NF-kappa-B inhibitor cactus-like [Ctenocephalides felis]
MSFSKQDVDLSSSDNQTKVEESTANQHNDSGFLSGNLVSSDDICDSSIEQSNQMRLDSGIIDDIRLGETFSNLSLKGASTDLNDFDKLKCRDSETKSSVQEPSVIVTDEEKAPWEIYYQQDEDGNTQLHLSILARMTEACKAVIAMAPHPCLLDIRNDSVRAPLHYAIIFRQAEIVRLLLIAGADVTVQDRYGNTPLHLATRLGYMDCVQAITSPIQETEWEQAQQLFFESGHRHPDTCPPKCPLLPPDFEQWNYDGEVCIHMAAKDRHFDIIRHLVWYGADINAREGKSGCTILHQAVKNNDRPFVAFLLNECPKLELETETYAGRTAYQLATDKEIMSMLESKGAIPLEHSDDEFSDSDDQEMSSSSTQKLYNNHNFQTNAINVA